MKKTTSDLNYLGAYKNELIEGLRNLALLKAVRKGDIISAARFLDMGAELNPVNQETTPLIEAVKADDPLMVDFLLSREGIDLSLKDSKGFTAVDYSGTLYIAYMLLKHGADLSFRAGRISYANSTKILDILWENYHTKKFYK